MDEPAVDNWRCAKPSCRARSGIRVRIRSVTFASEVPSLAEQRVFPPTSRPRRNNSHITPLLLCADKPQGRFCSPALQGSSRGSTGVNVLCGRTAATNSGERFILTRTPASHVGKQESAPSHPANPGLEGVRAVNASRLL